MKTKKIIISITLIIVATTIPTWFILNNQIKDSNEEFGIYLMDNTIVISEKNIINYNRTSHEIKLNQEGINNINNLDLIRKPFQIKLNNKVIYGGSFWSNMLSSSTSDIVIIDILFFESNSPDTIRIDQCYPSSIFCTGEDLRDNHEIFDFFQRIGKLIQ